MADRPTFVIAGAARCGTTALSIALSRHPDVHVSPRKEGCYFLFRDRAGSFAGPGDDYLVRHAVRTAEEYRRQFDGAGAARAVGEASVYYLAEPWVFHRIAAELPGVRVVVILRDPATRAFSAWAHMVRDGREHLPFREALRAEEERRRAGWEWSWRYRELGAYAGPIEVLRAAIDPSRILFLRYDDLRDAPARVLARCFDFLGVGAPPRPISVPHVNPSGRSRSRRLTRLMLGDHPTAAAALRLLPATVRRWTFLRVQRWNTGSLPPLDPDIDDLRDGFAREVARTAELTGLDCSPWVSQATRTRRATDQDLSGR